MAQHNTLITEREKWLMRHARLNAEYYDSLEAWLDDVVDDAGHTVAMALAHDAPVSEGQ